MPRTVIVKHLVSRNTLREHRAPLLQGASRLCLMRNLSDQEQHRSKLEYAGEREAPRHLHENKMKGSDLFLLAFNIVDGVLDLQDLLGVVIGDFHT